MIFSPFLIYALPPPLSSFHLRFPADGRRASPPLIYSHPSLFVSLLIHSSPVQIVVPSLPSRFQASRILCGSVPVSSMHFNSLARLLGSIPARLFSMAFLANPTPFQTVVALPCPFRCHRFSAVAYQIIALSFLCASPLRRSLQFRAIKFQFAAINGASLLFRFRYSVFDAVPRLMLSMPLHFRSVHFYSVSLQC